MTNSNISPKTFSPLTVGCLIYPQQDQIDFTGPFEVLSRMPNTKVHIIAKSLTPVPDIKGLLLTPDTTIETAPPLDVLLVPGGLGQQAQMEDQEVLSLIKRQADLGKYVFSVCTGALLCGAAGILQGKRATTHWASWDLLHYYGAIAVKSRVEIDGHLISTAGITAGIDGALTVAALLRGTAVAEQIQLELEYAPEPPFHSGTPHTAKPETIQAFFETYGRAKASREKEAQRFAARQSKAS